MPGKKFQKFVESLNAIDDIVEKDYSEYVKGYRKAARQGLAQAQEALNRLGETW
ncbi:MAG: hypothetical protein IJP69_01965 [Synergistaceae bacterium]|nr:hypothetical protein [Synergistaceae bacterium]MBR0251853.1 hypothetical protein [Synergistaceae bacterium]